MDDDMAQGEVKVWHGFTLGSLGGIAVTLFVSAVGLTGIVWGAGTAYNGVLNRLETVEKVSQETKDAVKEEGSARRQEHRETIDLICAMEHQIDSKAVCAMMQHGGTPPEGPERG